MIFVGTLELSTILIYGMNSRGNRPKKARDEEPAKKRIVATGIIQSDCAFVSKMRHGVIYSVVVTVGE